ncbi:MAG: hypothetical protein R3A11_06345 [Bdellovibrionota bacterium]
MNNMWRSSFLVIGLLLACEQSMAQYEDVCCILSKENGDTIDTLSQVMSKKECGGGSQSQGYTAKASLSDPNNEICPTITSETMCQKLGYFYKNGQCFKEDPAKKIKELKQRVDKLEERAPAKENTPAYSSGPVSKFPSPDENSSDDE